MEVKRGADEALLAEVGVMGLAREIAADRMGMLKPMIDAVVAIQSEAHLFSSPTLLAPQMMHALSQVGNDFPEGEANRSCRNAIYQAAMKLHRDSARLSADECRKVLLREVGHQLFQERCLDPADGYIRRHRNLDEVGHHEFEQNLHRVAGDRLEGLMRSIYDRRSGTPAKEFRKLPGNGIRVKSDSADSLRNAVLASLVEVAQ